MNETSQISTQICEVHNIPMIEKTLFGYHTYVYCEKCTQEAKERERIEEEERKKRWILESYKDGIPKLFHEARLANMKEIDPVLSWVNNPDGFCFVYGKCGCGKSYLSCSIKRFMNENKKQCKLIFSSDMFLRIRSTFGDSEESEYGIIKSLSSYKIALFDDVGAQKLSDFAIETWYNIVDTRYRESLPTFFTSNLSLKEISACMSDRVASRLASGIVFEMKGGDRRIMK